MKKPKIVMGVIKEDNGYSAHVKVQNICINTQGDDLEDLKINILDAVNLAFEDKNLRYEFEEISLKPDLRSFFEFYKVINAKALSERIGMNQSLLSQYIKGGKKPSPTQVDRILKGVQQIGKELTEVRFLL